MISKDNIFLFVSLLALFVAIIGLIKVKNGKIHIIKEHKLLFLFSIIPALILTYFLSDNLVITNLFDNKNNVDTILEPDNQNNTEEVLPIETENSNNKKSETEKKIEKKNNDIKNNEEYIDINISLDDYGLKSDDSFKVIIDEVELISDDIIYLPNNFIRLHIRKDDKDKIEIIKGIN